MNDYRSSHLAQECASKFDRHYTSGRGHLYWQNFEKPYLEKLFTRLGKEYPGRYLDFACGTGRILQIGFPHFIDSVGMDISEVMLAEARRRVPGARLIQTDVMLDPPDVGKFNVVSLFRFILSAEHHLRGGVLHWLRSVITPDGVLVLNNHLNRRSILGIIHRMDNTIHGRRGGPPADKDVEILLQRCGFRVFERYGFGVVPPWRNRGLFPSTPLLYLEHLLGKSKTLQNYAKDRIYLCHPI
ncbi:MAG: class I SAM-dependent DNA methyltransferase [Thermodesulfobacteriota bacterium]